MKEIRGLEIENDLHKKFLSQKQIEATLSMKCQKRNSLTEIKQVTLACIGQELRMDRDLRLVGISLPCLFNIINCYI